MVKKILYTIFSIFWTLSKSAMKCMNMSMSGMGSGYKSDSKSSSSSERTYSINEEAAAYDAGFSSAKQANQYGYDTSSFR